MNGGVPGDTAQQGCERMPALVAEHQPALILVFLGGNDILRRRPASAITEGLEACVHGAQAEGKPLVLLAVPSFGITGFDDVPLFAEFAEAGRSRGSARDSASCCATMRCAPTRSTSTPTAIARSPRTSRASCVGWATSRSNCGAARRPKVQRASAFLAGIRMRGGAADFGGGSGGR